MESAASSIILLSHFICTKLKVIFVNKSADNDQIKVDESMNCRKWRSLVK